MGRCEVVVLEATKEPLAKVLISGGGRCNVMHDPMKTPSEISTGYPRGSRELIGALTSQFTPWDTFDWFSSSIFPSAFWTRLVQMVCFPSILP